MTDESSQKCMVGRHGSGPKRRRPGQARAVRVMARPGQLIFGWRPGPARKKPESQNFFFSCKKKCEVKMRSKLLNYKNEYFLQ